MNDFVRQGLYLQGLPIYESDIPYICNIILTIQQNEVVLNGFPHLNEEVPIAIVDKGLLR